MMTITERLWLLRLRFDTRRFMARHAVRDWWTFR